MLKLDHVYIKVTDLNKAISFYQKVFGRKINLREENRWADFDSDKGVYIGIFNAKNDEETFTIGNNITIGLKTNNIQNEHERIKDLKPKTITEIIHLSQPYDYYYFQFEDEWGNIFEVAEY